MSITLEVDEATLFRILGNQPGPAIDEARDDAGVIAPRGNLRTEHRDPRIEPTRDDGLAPPWLRPFAT